MIFTHKGWMFLCPVYLFYPANDIPDVVARYDFLYYWMIANEYMIFLFCLILHYTIGQFMKNAYELNPFHSISKLDYPINIDGDYDVTR